VRYPVYLVDFSNYKPPESMKVSTKKGMEMGKAWCTYTPQVRQTRAPDDATGRTKQRRRNASEPTKIYSNTTPPPPPPPPPPRDPLPRARPPGPRGEKKKQAGGRGGGGGGGGESK